MCSWEPQKMAEHVWTWVYLTPPTLMVYQHCRSKKWQPFGVMKNNTRFLDTPTHFRVDGGVVGRFANSDWDQRAHQFHGFLENVPCSSMIFHLTWPFYRGFPIARFGCRVEKPGRSIANDIMAHQSTRWDPPVMFVGFWTPLKVVMSAINQRIYQVSSASTSLSYLGDLILYLQR